MSSNKSIRNLMVFNYGNKCWLGGKITKKNPLTYHHICKNCDGGARTIENGALLTRSMHDLLHKLEFINPKMYDLINDLFQLYKIELDEELISEMETLLYESLEQKVVLDEGRTHTRKRNKRTRQRAKVR